MLITDGDRRDRGRFGELAMILGGKSLKHADSGALTVMFLRLESELTHR